jgi:hypothetical protein
MTSHRSSQLRVLHGKHEQRPHHKKGCTKTTRGSSSRKRKYNRHDDGRTRTLRSHASSRTRAPSMRAFRSDKTSLALGVSGTCSTRRPSRQPDNIGAGAGAAHAWRAFSTSALPDVPIRKERASRKIFLPIPCARPAQYGQHTQARGAIITMQESICGVDEEDPSSSTGAAPAPERETMARSAEMR